MRLAKYLAHCGVASRRAAEKLIAAGRVTVGGEVLTDPARDVDVDSDVAVDGSHGPARGARDLGPEQAPRRDLDRPRAGPAARRHGSGASGKRLYPVGRLDADSTGLILLTNDGELANVLTHPRYGVPKTYRARLRGPIGDARDRAPARRASSSRTGRPRRRRCGGSDRARSRSRSARAATDRSGGCCSGSATRSRACERVRFASLRARHPAGGQRRGSSRVRRCRGSGRMRGRWTSPRTDDADERRAHLRPPRRGAGERATTASRSSPRPTSCSAS